MVVREEVCSVVTLVSVVIGASTITFMGSSAGSLIRSGGGVATGVATGVDTATGESATIIGAFRFPPINAIQST